MTAQKILLFGGTGQTGLEIVRALSDQTDTVTVVARETSNTSEVEAAGALVIRADVFDEDELAKTVASTDCSKAICTIGNRAGGSHQNAGRKVDFDGVRNVVDACVNAGIDRFVLISSIGCGDSRPALSERALKFLGDMCDRKTLGEDHLRATDLKWTIIRPGGLSSHPPTGNAILSEDPTVSGEVRRSDVAQLTVACLDNAESIGAVYSAVDPSLS